MCIRDRPKPAKGPLGWFFRIFNRAYDGVNNGYVGLCRGLIRKSALSLMFLGLVAVGAGWFGKTLPTGFLPEEDQGFLYVCLLYTSRCV